MSHKTKYFALLFVLTAAFPVHAQQAATDDEAGPVDQLVPVADEGADAVELPDSADSSLIDERLLAAEFERYKRLIQDGALDEADTSAKRIVEMAIRIYGPRSHETSKALNNLALVQNRNAQYEAAIQNFESSIEIIEILEDRLNERLVNPLTGLGAAQMGNGRPDLALGTFKRATHITHVNEGPHNLEQVEILESVAEANLRMGDTKGARNILNRIHVLNVRHFQNNELALISSLMRRANWQHRAGYYNDERATYRRMIRIIEIKLGKNDPQLIFPLSKLGQSFYFTDLSRPDMQQQGLSTTGEVYFKRAARIAEATPDIDWRQLVDTKLALADHYIVVESFSRARRIYTEVWEQLSSDDDRLAARAELMERPVELLSGSLPRYTGSSTDTANPGNRYLPGTIRVDYTVSIRGRVRNIRTEAIPEEFTDMQRMVHREVRNRVFRPQMVDAELRQSENLVFEHPFLYRQAELDKLKEAKQQSTSQSAKDNSTT